MKFLLDMNVPRQLARRMAEFSHTCRHVGDIGMAQSSDVVIMEEARSNEETIITHDLDYGHLLAFSGEPDPSVIILRLRNTHPDKLFEQITGKWAEIEEPLSKGAIVVLEDAAFRIRPLPIRRDDG